MNFESQDIFSSRLVRSVLTLLIIYFSQIYPYSHEHSHLDSIATASNDHQHAFDKHIDWYLVRLQNNNSHFNLDLGLFYSPSIYKAGKYQFPAIIKDLHQRTDILPAVKIPRSPPRLA